MISSLSRVHYLTCGIEGVTDDSLIQKETEENETKILL